MWLNRDSLFKRVDRIADGRKIPHVKRAWSSRGVRVLERRYPKTRRAAEELLKAAQLLSTVNLRVAEVHNQQLR